MHHTPLSSLAARCPESLLAAVAAVLAAATVMFACGGPDVLTGRPIQFECDAVFHYTLAQAVLDDGWTWYAHRLAAPFGCDLLSFGLDLPVESLLLRLLAFTTDDCIALLNRAWIVLCGVAAAGGYAAFRLLGLPRSAALVCGCLFATTPYIYFRSVSHFNVHVAFVPLPTAAAVLVLTDGLRGLRRGAWRLLVGGCFLVGIGFIYYSFFSCVLLAHSLAIAWLTGRTGSLVRGLVCLVVVGCGTALNLAPVAIDWATYGKPAELTDRQPQHADLLGLRIRELIMPSEFTPVPGLREIGAKVSRVPWPPAGERNFAKLGTIGAIGFVICLWVLAGVRPPGDPRHAAAVRAAATCTLMLVMIGVVGGFGSIFNVFVTPAIRCYNRVMPQLAILALVPCGSLLHAAAGRCGGGIVSAALPAAVLAFGLIEQNSAWFIRHQAPGHLAERANLESFVRMIEGDARPGAAVLMLPATPFPNDGGHGTMRPYDHAKAYLFSRHLRWSWPVFGSRQRSLMESLGPVGGPEFIDRVRAAGFSYAWIDRRAENAAANEAGVTAGGGRLHHVDDSGRYGFYVLAEASRER
jgi:phosphoglycerol transferase